MRRIILAALITSFAVGSALAQSCETKAMGKDGKPLAGAAKSSFVKKCKQGNGQRRQAARRRREKQLHDEVREGRVTASTAHAGGKYADHLSH